MIFCASLCDDATFGWLVVQDVLAYGSSLERDRGPIGEGDAVVGLEFSSRSVCVEILWYRPQVCCEPTTDVEHTAGQVHCVAVIVLRGEGGWSDGCYCGHLVPRS